MNVSNYTEIPSLDEVEEEYFLEKGIPGVIFLSILSIFGVIGNIHILIVYKVSKQMAKRAVRTFILWLSAIDLIACMACMPFEIVDIRLTYTFKSSEACKFFWFLSHVVSLSSGAILAAIAIQRFRMAYTPGPTANPTRVLNAISAIIVVTLTTTSVPAFFFYGVDKKELIFSEINGTDCVVLSQHKNIKNYGAYGSVMILLSLVFLIICARCYGHLLYIMYKQTETKSHRSQKGNNLSKSPVVSSTNTEELSEIRVEFNSNTNKVRSDKLDKRKGFDKGRQLTIGLITATAISFTGYIIFVATNLVMLTNPVLFIPGENILLRAFFINNAANPVVFFSLDGIFREECLKLYKKSTYMKKATKP